MLHKSHRVFSLEDLFRKALTPWEIVEGGILMTFPLISHLLLTAQRLAPKLKEILLSEHSTDIWNDNNRNVRSPVHFDSWVVYMLTQESKPNNNNRILITIIIIIILRKLIKLSLKQKVLGTINRLLSFYRTRTAWKTTRPVILLCFSYFLPQKLVHCLATIGLIHLETQRLIHEVRHWDGLRCRDVLTKFH